MHSPLWLPYAQMQRTPAPLEVASASGAVLTLADGRRLVDAVSSWWCVIYGYSHPRLNAALQRQGEAVGHVMLGGLAAPVTRRLAERLVAITPEGLQHVFFSDSGSVGVEVALKMALQYFRNTGRPGKSRFLALEHAYHGDTTGCMAVCDPEEGMHRLFAGWVPPQHFLPTPAGGLDASEAEVEREAERLASFLAAHHEEVAGMIVEPVLQAAGGLLFYPPAYLRRAREICDRYDVLLLFDEVATGFGRTGTRFALERAGVTPDILVLGKGLTGGLLGHAATLATGRVFDAFLGEEGEKAFMHGPTYMGNALACAVALEALDLFEEEDALGRVARIEAILREELLALRASAIRETRVLGAVGVVEARDAAALEGLQAFALERGVWLRPFGNVAYTMPPYVIAEEELRRVTGVLRDWFARR